MMLNFNNSYQLLFKFFTLLLLPTVGFSQEFGTLDTYWKHCLTPDIEPGNVIIGVTVEDTTTFAGLGCSILRSEDFVKIGNTSLDSILICNSGSRAYYAEGDSLFLLYDFSVQAGGSYQIKFPVELNSDYQSFFPNESLYWDIYVDSVDFINIDGVLLRKQYIHYRDKERESLIYLGDWVMEKFGYQTWIFPFLSFGEYNPNCSLLEFSDEQIHQIDTSSFCFISGIHDFYNIQANISIWPNPCADFLFIKSSVELKNIYLTNTQGGLVAVTPSRSELDLSFCPPGVYFLYIETKEGMAVQRILKQ